MKPWIQRALVGVVVALSSATALSQQIGSWSIDLANYTKRQSDNIYAATVNDSDNVFGQYCYPEEGSCMWILSVSTRCVEKSTYPVLASSEGGAASLEVICVGKFTERYYRYAFADFNKVDSLVRSGTRIGIVFPLSGAGEFKAIRFELNGAVTAIDKMRSAAEKLATSAPKGTRDTKL